MRLDLHFLEHRKMYMMVIGTRYPPQFVLGKIVNALSAPHKPYVNVARHTKLRLRIKPPYSLSFQHTTTEAVFLEVGQCLLCTEIQESVLLNNLCGVSQPFHVQTLVTGTLPFRKYPHCGKTNGYQGLLLAYLIYFFPLRGCRYGRQLKPDAQMHLHQLGKQTI